MPNTYVETLTPSVEIRRRFVLPDFRPPVLNSRSGARLESESVVTLLEAWQTMQGLGKKPATQKFHAEIVKIIQTHLPGLHRRITDFAEHEFQDFAQKVAHYCPSRWNAMVTVLRHITGRPKLLKYRKLRFRDFKPPNQLEFSRLLAECDKSARSHVGLVVRFLSLTGLRIAEARQLTWYDIRDGYIFVPAAITKNGLARTVPMLPGTAEILDRLRAIGDGTRVLPKGEVRTALRAACRRADLPQMSYHCFRHLYATRCVSAGVDLPTVAKWLGHSDGGTLLGRLYFHLLDDHSLKMASRVQIGV